MKYIKKFESKRSLIPNAMYLFNKSTPCCFLGYDDEHSEFPLIFIMFPHEKLYRWDTPVTKFSGIQWVPYVEDQELTKLDISLKDYLIKNNLAAQAMIEFEQLYGLHEHGKKLLKKLHNDLKKDKDFQLQIKLNKYNI